MKRKGLSQFSKIRIQVEAILQGPKNIRWSIGSNDDLAHFGTKVLFLMLKDSQSDSLFNITETRAIYANIFDDSQGSAFLRAVQWDDDLARKLIQEDPETFDKLLPARFVSVDIDHLKKWLSAFDGLNITVESTCRDDLSSTIRGLRIELDYVSCIIENIWQRESSSHAEINRIWDDVWGQMTEILKKNNLVSSFSENYWLTVVEPAYCSELYDPDVLMF
jgi:hypothetical protein